MIPAQFEYLSPSTLKEAISLLNQHPDDAKILAGGHSLIPAMKLRLAQPGMLIDIGRIKDLAYITNANGQIQIGAMTTHYQIESSARLLQICPLLPEAAGHIGDVQVRNRGTIGGSLAHADPAADWPAVALALDAQIVVSGAAGERTIKADDLFVDMMTTSIKPGEILREIRIQIPQGKVGQAYQKVFHPASGFAVVGVAVNLTRGADGKCQSARIGITGAAVKAYRANGTEQALVGSSLDEAAIARAAALAGDGVDFNADLYASAEYRHQLVKVYTARAIREATSRAV